MMPATCVSADGTLGTGMSGLNGDLDLYERIQRDLKRQRGVANLFVLGDLVGAHPSCNALLERLRRPRPGRMLRRTAFMAGEMTSCWPSVVTAVSARRMT